LVVISHYNSWPTDQLVALLDQMREIPSGHPFRCLVVVNQAVDRPLELPAAHADVEILYRENTGYNIGAWDYGWRNASRADYYLFLQEECQIIRPDWLGSFVRMLSRPGVGLVGESRVWRGLKWNRLEYLHDGSWYGDEPGDPPIPFIDGIRRYLDSEGIPIGETGDHLRAIILATHREVLEAIDGFGIGHTKVDAISCEIGISQAVASKRLAIKQVGITPFRYIVHPQWTFYDSGVYSRLLQWTDRSVPLSMIWIMRRMIWIMRISIQRLCKLLTGTPRHGEIPAVEMADPSVSKQEARPT
jgi:hypothetical protein